VSELPSVSLQQQKLHAVDELLSLQDMIRWAVSRMSEAGIYFGHGTDNPMDEAVLLVTHALALPWNQADQWRDCRLTRQERECIAELVVCRIEQRVPAPYLVGEAWFCGLPYVVDERVLIPRSPIAELIENSFQPWLTHEPKRIMDLCTGSGCIGIACAMQFEHAEVELLDISFDALAVAEENIQRLQVEDRVIALQSDLFAAASGKYDLIVSNPPYVDSDDMACLPDEFHHEPELALAAGDDGLDLVRIMLSQARDLLTDDGVLVVEVGNSWPALAKAYPHLPFQWQEFERGGHGVFVLNAADLDNLSSAQLKI
jgi:ribosomal protein L3 glutamine methyltransferase